VGTEVPPYDQIFGYAGYRLERASHKSPNLGVRFNATEQGLEIVDVGADTPGARAGLQRGDLVTKIDDARPRSSPGGGFSLTNALEGKIDQTVKLTVRRGGEEKVLEAKVGAREQTDYKLVEVQNATPEQLKVREGWLKR
jgi:C-terminal processing protease CtpA/Prc